MLMQKWLILILVCYLTVFVQASDFSEKRRPSRFNLSAEGGSGLIRTLSPYALAPGNFAAGFFAMNFDRFPGDIDVVELSVQAAVGIPGRGELFFQFSPVLRTNAVDLDPLRFPVPPVDLFVDTFPDSARRPEPFLVFAQEFPFKTFFPDGITIQPPGDGAFAASTGDLKFGAKFNLLDERRGHRIGLGVRGYAEIPTEKPVYNSPDWRSYAGVSGEPNFGFDLLASKVVGSAEILINGGYKKVGDPERGLRIQFVDSGASDPRDFVVGEPVEYKLDLRDRLLISGGTTFPAFNAWGLPMWFLGEISYLRYVGKGTPVERLVHPLEMRAGLQGNLPFYKPLALGVAWQLLFNDAGDGDRRRSPFVTPDGKGDINFSELVNPVLSEQVRNFFAGRGIEFSENSSKLFSTDNPEFDEWRNIPSSPRQIIGQGGGAIIFFLTWRIDGR